jgi:hypothetical protein
VLQELGEISPKIMKERAMNSPIVIYGEKETTAMINATPFVQAFMRNSPRNHKK